MGNKRIKDSILGEVEGFHWEELWGRLGMNIIKLHCMHILNSHTLNKYVLKIKILNNKESESISQSIFMFRRKHC